MGGGVNRNGSPGSLARGPGGPGTWGPWHPKAIIQKSTFPKTISKMRTLNVENRSVGAFKKVLFFTIKYFPYLGLQKSTFSDPKVLPVM